jgi:hypothetical protein
MPEYDLVFSHTASNNQPVIFPDIFTGPTIAIEADILVQNKPTWYQVGWVQALTGSSIGSIRGGTQRVKRGRHEFNLQIPSTPYQLVFLPKPWVMAWTLTVYQRVIPPALEPVALDSNLIFQKLLDLEAKIDAL